MNPDTAFELLQKYVHGETLLRHCKTVGLAMRYFAEKYGESPDYWESVGILHDIDLKLRRKVTVRNALKYSARKNQITRRLTSSLFMRFRATAGISRWM